MKTNISGVKFSGNGPFLLRLILGVLVAVLPSSKVCLVYDVIQIILIWFVLCVTCFCAGLVCEKIMTLFTVISLVRDVI